MKNIDACGFILFSRLGLCLTVYRNLEAKSSCHEIQDVPSIADGHSDILVSHSHRHVTSFLTAAIVLALIAGLN